jgi:hypothetical protein
MRVAARTAQAEPDEPLVELAGNEVDRLIAECADQLRARNKAVREKDWLKAGAYATAARRLAEEAVEANDAHAIAWAAKGLALGFLNQFDEAVRCLREAVRADLPEPLPSACSSVIALCFAHYRSIIAATGGRSARPELAELTTALHMFFLAVGVEV